MPYITDEAKRQIGFGDRLPQGPGEVNWLACCAALDYLRWLRDQGGKVGYAQISSAVSALEEAAAELRRRLLAPYEDECIARNGDIIPQWLLDLVKPKPPSLDLEAAKAREAAELYPPAFRETCPFPNCPICNHP